MSQDVIARAQPRDKGHWYEDFEPGRVFVHHWGRTLSQAENALFTTLTLHFNPQYTNVEVARAMGHPDTPVNPLLVFNTVFGLSVQDLSEHGTAFLGVDELRYPRAFYPGDTLFARSTVLDRRLSTSRKNLGIVGWHTQGFNQRDELVCEFHRSNLVFLRGDAA
ncbi:MAG: MaoC family dehydratase [Proteobacteria bacterium]|nr:MaoC family dehydratase [Pseudomonadota bacterium]